MGERSAFLLNIYKELEPATKDDIYQQIVEQNLTGDDLKDAVEEGNFQLDQAMAAVAKAEVEKKTAEDAVAEQQSTTTAAEVGIERAQQVVDKAEEGLKGLKTDNPDKSLRDNMRMFNLFIAQRLSRIILDKGVPVGKYSDGETQEQAITREYLNELQGPFVK